MFKQYQYFASIGVVTYLNRERVGLMGHKSTHGLKDGTHDLIFRSSDLLKFLFDIKI